MKATLRIQVTKDYGLFQRSDANRSTDPRKRHALKESMKLYGFLACYPIVCYRSGGKLFIKDGQHRAAFAQELGLPIFWVEVEVDFDVAIVNSTAKVWTLRDYADVFIKHGRSAYSVGLEFAEQHQIPLGRAFALLAGTTSFVCVWPAYRVGKFRVKDLDWANLVASIYSPMIAIARELRNARFLEACMAVCRVEGFDPNRLVGGAKRCREKLASYSTRDAYLTMIEELYNHGRKVLVGIKSQAIEAMRKRNPGAKKASDNGEASKPAAHAVV